MRASAPMTFKAWWDALEMRDEPLPVEYAQDFEACWTAAQFALNSEVGITSNEAAKAERRKVAVQAIIDQFAVYGKRPELDAIIKAAQG